MPKRVLDILVATIVLVATLPLTGLVALAIVVDSPGPVFFRVSRVGHRGRSLRMLKFRKMHVHADGGPLTADDDPRLTRVGAVLARTRLDELPQLWHVLRGKMSLIGPRPEDPSFVALRPDDYDAILRVRPGICGLSQLAFADERRLLGEHDPMRYYVERILPQKCALDRLYATRASVRVDVRIAAWTLVAVGLGLPVAVHRSTGAISLRRRHVHEPQEATTAEATADGPQVGLAPLGTEPHTVAAPAPAGEAG